MNRITLEAARGWPISPDNALYTTRLEAVNQISVGASPNGYLDIVTTPTGVGFKWRS